MKAFRNLNSLVLGKPCLLAPLSAFRLMWTLFLSVLFSPPLVAQVIHPGTLGKDAKRHGGLASMGQTQLNPKDSGKVYAWGWNDYGQLGNGTFTFPPREGAAAGIATPGLANIPGTVVAVAGGGEHSLALTSDSKVYAWGENGLGQLGNGTFSNSGSPFFDPFGIATPGLVNVPGKVVAVAGGGEHSLALTSEGKVYAWGSNMVGQLGNGTFTTSRPWGIATPVLVNVPGKVVVVAGGGGHSLALTGTPLSIVALDPTSSSDPTNMTPASTTMLPSVLRVNSFLPDTWRTQILLKITGPSSTTLRVYVTNPQQQGPGTDDGHNHFDGRVHGWLYAYKAGDTRWKNYPALPVKTQEGSADYSDYDSAGTSALSQVTTDSNGNAYVYYTAPSISGYETITVSTVDTDPTKRQTADLPLILQMPDFSALSESDTIHLIGQTTDHPDNHYGTATMNQALQALALNYKNELKNGKLPVNDMSLPWGGLFDLDTDWDANSGHVGHRRGIEADLGLPTGNTAFQNLLAAQGWWDTNPSLWKSEGNHYHILLNRAGTPFILYPGYAYPGSSSPTSYTGSITTAWQDTSNRLLRVTLPLLNRGGIDAASLMFTSFTFSNGVTLNTALPLVGPGVGIQQQASVMITVKVPANVHSFSVTPKGYAVVAGSSPYNVNFQTVVALPVKVP